MHVAFYAPMKSPAHAVPSGDRRVARLLIAALRHAGHKVSVASHLRTWNGSGEAAPQERLMRRGLDLARRYVDRCRGAPPDLWFTYHLYHKAPDWIGPAVCKGLTLPYVAAEVSFAPKQENGPWALGHAAVRDALGRLDGIIHMNPLDEACVRPHLRSACVAAHLPPFLDLSDADRALAGRTEERAGLAARLGLDPARPWLVATGMMRPGDKLRSYQALGAALRRIADRPWELLVIGDGPARADVETALGPAGPVRFLGQLDPAGVMQVQAACDLFVWPAVNEAYGLALLEAQAVGLAAVAGDSPGVASIVRNGATGRLVPGENASAFGDAVASLLDDSAGRADMGRAARQTVVASHGLATAAALIGGVVEQASVRARR